MPSRASGFCIYDDPALAIARARQAGLRVLYVDLDVHHGDGVEAIHRDDPGVLTVSFHESGRYLFPGTGRSRRSATGSAAGSVVNVPFEPGTGRGGLADRRRDAAARSSPTAFGPDIVVSQHGCDTHAWDPLAHLNVTTTAMGAAARLVDAIAHRWAGGRWLATGGGGYGVYRVVPRAWAHVWLAAAHREAPDRLPEEWRSSLVRRGRPIRRSRRCPRRSTIPPNAGIPFDAAQRDAEARSLAIAALARHLSRPAAHPRGGRIAAGGRRSGRRGRRLAAGDVDAERLGLRPGTWRSSRTSTGRRSTGSSLAPRLVANLDERSLRDILRSPAARPHDGGRRGDCRRASSRPPSTIRRRADAARSVLAIGVAPACRRQGLATRMLAGARRMRSAGPATTWAATVTVAERDPVEPLDRALRGAIAARIYEGAGFRSVAPDRPLREADPGARRFVGTDRAAAPRHSRQRTEHLVEMAVAAYTLRSVVIATPVADPLAPFSPAVRAWFEATFEAPTQAQAEGWAAISAGHHTLIHAPTGSGKTLAAFLWTLDRLAATPRPPQTREQPGHASASSTSRRSRR